MANTNIAVEGIADKKFLEDYLKHLGIEEVTILVTDGWSKIFCDNQNDEKIANPFKCTTDNDGVNLIIFDADENIQTRKDEVNQWLTDNELKAHMFLFPNNCDKGALETLLERIINPKHADIFECWKKYETCLILNNPNYNIPAKKSKIYCYLEVLCGCTHREKERVKDAKRDYCDCEHWNLEHLELTRLKEFLQTYIK